MFKIRLFKKTKQPTRITLVIENPHIVKHLYELTTTTNMNFNKELFRPVVKY